ncbi:hypothetical protein L6452_02935 [Arctium lappa]|uniref:Uncharacterized protein n=1 Tax=Arctium lappa TaxID=4217 RepID=A0ACB9FKT2_ARCLA|nr:hypothetical protein L6452_02935 [Arctium lappa]
MVSVERIKQFTKIPSEVKWVKKDNPHLQIAFSWHHRAQRFAIDIVQTRLRALLFRSGVVFRQSVPELYIFGDSLVDAENNNFLALSLAKANFPYNDVDFPTGKATGRFTEKVGLPSAPPYLSLVTKSKKLSSSNVTVTGISFASGGARIFNGTDELFVRIYTS